MTHHEQDPWIKHHWRIPIFNDSPQVLNYLYSLSMGWDLCLPGHMDGGNDELGLENDKNVGGQMGHYRWCRFQCQQRPV